MTPCPSLRRGALLALLALVTMPALPGVDVLVARGSALRAQTPDQAGPATAGLLLRRLEGVKRVLMIGAHPDDEDSGFLAEMARGQGAETAYLSLTRGDGGQNLIGPELFEGLGVIRTGELEAARALDGGRQYFTRAFDFGFSKTAEEALSLWPREELLADVVEVIRRFRPQVVVSVFSGTPSDGHGHHQAAGIITREAFRAAGDPARFPEQLTGGLEAWRPLKLLQTSRRRFLPDAPAVDEEIVVPMGALDPLLGRSRFQVAMDSRSQHRSQDMGAAQPMGPRNSGVVLVDALVPRAEESVFSGIDTTLVGLVTDLPGDVAARVATSLGAYRSAVGRARRHLGSEPQRAAMDLASAVGALDRVLVRDLQGEDPAVRLLWQTLSEKRALASRALASAAGVVFDVRASDDLLVPGQTVAVEAILWNGGTFGLRAPEVALRHRADRWSVRRVGVQGLGPDGILAPGAVATWSFQVELPADAEVSRLYYLREERDGAMYRWPEDPSLRGQPRDPASVHGVLSFGVGSEVGTAVELEEAWRYVGLDQAFGEFEEPVLVVPAVSVRATPAGTVWPTGVPGARPVSVTVRTEMDGGASGRVRLEAPSGWRVMPVQQDFELSASGSERTLTFDVAPDGQARTGVHRLRAVATASDERTFDEGFSLIDYPHIERAVMLTDAETEISVVDVRAREGLRVGYIMGTGDDGHEAIRQMGVDVELLSADQVRSGSFDGYDVLVLGVRAYEAREDVRAANEQILDFARDGGVVVNQYNQYQFSNGEYAPHRLVIGQPAPRVSVETQPVRVLRPEAPVFTTPNRLSGDDFEGWVQERGLYFASEWADAFVPLLEMNDPGEPPRHGSLLVSSVGDGVYVYAALSFFRQWSQRVPGAYRLFANLISLTPEAWQAGDSRAVDQAVAGLQRRCEARQRETTAEGQRRPAEELTEEAQAGLSHDQSVQGEGAAQIGGRQPERHEPQHTHREPGERTVRDFLDSLGPDPAGRRDQEDRGGARPDDERGPFPEEGAPDPERRQHHQRNGPDEGQCRGLPRAVRHLGSSRSGVTSQRARPDVPGSTVSVDSASGCARAPGGPSSPSGARAVEAATRGAWTTTGRLEEIRIHSLPRGASAAWSRNPPGAGLRHPWNVASVVRARDTAAALVGGGVENDTAPRRWSESTRTRTSVSPPRGASPRRGWTTSASSGAEGPAVEAQATTGGSTWSHPARAPSQSRPTTAAGLNPPCRPRRPRCPWARRPPRSTADPPPRRSPPR